MRMNGWMGSGGEDIGRPPKVGVGKGILKKNNPKKHNGFLASKAGNKGERKLGKFIVIVF